MSESQKKPVFIHSLFRTGSTYIWSKFRKNENFWCYYEPFHQNLANIGPANPIAWAYDPNATAAMRHPEMKVSHSREYEELLKPDHRGVPFFKKSFTFDEFCFTGDNPDARQYIDSLIENAGDKQPVFQFNRTALRTQWFKANYPGSINVYILRNFKDQWFSYESMLSENSLDIFFVMDLLIASVNMNTDQLKELAKQIILIQYNSNKVIEEEMLYSRLLECYSKEELFYIFYYIWFYSLVENTLHADFLLDIDLLSTDISYRRQTCDRLKKMGIENVEFDDARIPNHNKEILAPGMVSKIKENIETIILKKFSDRQLRVLVSKHSDEEKKLLELDVKSIINVKKKKVKKIRAIEDAAHKYGRFVQVLTDVYIAKNSNPESINKKIRGQIEQLIERLKEREQAEVEDLKEKEKEIQRLKKKTREIKQLKNKEKEQLLSQKDDSISRLESEIKMQRFQMTKKDEQLALKDKTLSEKDEHIAGLKNELMQKEFLLAQKKSHITKLDQLLIQKKQQLKERNRRLRKIRKSYSYRLGRLGTAPLRLLGKSLRKKVPDRKSRNKKLAFIDHSFHQKSTATFFLVDMLKEHYDVEIFWDESWNGGPRVALTEIARQKYDTIILFQQISYSEKELKIVADKNLILIPMFDASGGKAPEFWSKFKHAKIVNFSKRLHKKLKRLGLMSKYFKYFPSPHEFPASDTDDDQLTGFFWQRTNQITWDHIRELIKKSNFDRIHIHTAVDPPGYPVILPSEDEKKKYHITTSQWFSQRKDYFRELEQANVFFAPRIYEGIGMSFLEAMAKGKCVVAPNQPTMNEYITHGKTGFLYEPDNPRPIDFSNVKEIGANARKSIETGYNQWDNMKEELIDFIRLPVKKPPFYRYFHYKLFHAVKRTIKISFPQPGQKV